MRPYLVRAACHDAFGQKVFWTGPGAWLLVGVAISLGLLALAGGPDPVEAQSYSAYSDPEKPAVGLILARERNAEEFQNEFDLTDEEMETAVAAARRENETLARAYAESQREIEAGGSGAEDAVSDYNATVREVVAETKSRIEALLPADRVPRLREWVDAKFAQEGREAAESAVVVDDRFSTSGSRKVRCKVWATHYDGYTRYEVALPHRRLKFEGGFKVPVHPVKGGRRVRAPVKEVGPWNTRDNYWEFRKNRTMWKDLPRCVPAAQAAYYRNYNGGKEEDGHIVRNPAGVDLTLAVAKRMRIGGKIKREGKVRVYVRYPRLRW